MTLVLFSVLLAAAATLWTVQPILARRLALLRDVAPGEALDAEARRQVALAALSELEYDYLGGKLDQADYEAQRERLGREAVQALRAAQAVQASRTRELPHEPGVHSCGFVNPTGSKFCGGCGEALA